MKKISCLFFSLLCASARPALCANSAGTAAVPFLKMAADARSVSMGEAVAGAASGGMAVFENPAGLALGLSPSVAFGHALLMDSISYEVIGAEVPLHKAGVLGVGVQYFSYGSFDSVDKNETVVGILSPRDSAYTLAWGMDVDPNVMVGGGLKYIDSRIAGSASTTALDLGVLLNIDRLSAGLALQNLGPGLKFDREVAPLPTNVKLGVSMLYRLNWHWVADLNFPKDGAAWLAAGAEYAFDVRGDWSLYGRAGYNTAAADTEGVNGLAAGFGLSHKRICFDYAFKTMGMLGTTHHLGISYRFPSVSPAR